MSDKCTDCDKLLAKIKELELQNFWARHSADRLSEAIRRFNMSKDEPRCACPLCIRAGYWDGEYPADHPSSKECRLRPLLFARMEECGLTIIVPDTTGHTPIKTAEHCSNEQGKVFKLDCHVVIPESHYASWTYGELIWKAELGSEELEKLSRFFKVLSVGV